MEIKSLGPFDFVKAINKHEDIMRDDNIEKQYEAFIINRAFSYFPDTIFLANEMNIHHNIGNKLANDFYLNTVRKNPKRFSKWNKKKLSGGLKAVKEYYGYNTAVAESAMLVLTNEQVDDIIKKVDKGGKRK